MQTVSSSFGLPGRQQARVGEGPAMRAHTPQLQLQTTAAYTAASSSYKSCQCTTQHWSTMILHAVDRRNSIQVEKIESKLQNVADGGYSVETTLFTGATTHLLQHGTGFASLFRVLSLRRSTRSSSKMLAIANNPRRTAGNNSRQN